VTVASAFSAGVAVKQGILMRSHGDLTGLIKFLARDDWKSSFEEVLGEHFGPAMQAFDLEYEAIGAALGGSGDMTLWGVAFEDFLGRQFEPDGRNFVDEYLRRRGWNEAAPTKAYMRGLRNSIMSLYEASAIVPAQSFLARDLLRGGAPVLISERTATRTLRIVVQGQKRILAGGVLAFTFEGSEQLMANLQEAAVQSPSSGRSAPSVKKPLIADDTLREMAPLFTSTWLSDVLPKALGLSRPTLHNSDGDEVVFHEVRFPFAPEATLKEIVNRLATTSSLHRENEAFVKTQAHRASSSKHRDRLLEQGVVLLVERGMDQFGLDLGRYIGGRARAVSLLRHHLLDGLDLRQRRCHQPAKGGAQHGDRALGSCRRIDVDDEKALLDLDIAEHCPAVLHRHVPAQDILSIVAGLWRS
jgi:hypothetical protein